GTRHLQRHHRLLKSKEAELKKKFKTFERQVSAFNLSYRNRQPIDCPTFDEVKAMAIDNSFWDFGGMTHPEEPWACDPKVQEGIKSYLDLTHAEDELRRIGRECRQLMNWSAQTHEKIRQLRKTVDTNDNSLENADNKWIVGLVGSVESADPVECLADSREVVEALLCNLTQSHCRLWMNWNRGLSTVLSGTVHCMDLAVGEEEALKHRWNVLIEDTKSMWEIIVKAPVIRGEIDAMEDEDNNIDEADLFNNNLDQINDFNFPEYYYDY
ncbi:hypothetical protein DFH28DRAFT_1187570, partial [Melampsora americana]